MNSHNIDSNKTPFIPKGLDIRFHIGFGSIPWNKEKYAKNCLPFEEEALLKSKSCMDLLPELTYMPVANASILDWLLENPEEIPYEAWRNKKILFFGTVYIDSCKKLSVRYLECQEHGFSYGVCSLNGLPNSKTCALIVG